MSERYRNDIEELQKLSNTLLNCAVSKDTLLREFQLSKVFEQQQRLILGVELLRQRLDRLAQQFDEECKQHREELDRIQTDVLAQHQLDFDAPAAPDAWPWQT